MHDRWWCDLGIELVCSELIFVEMKLSLFSKFLSYVEVI